MSKITHSEVKFTPEELAYELPDDIDVRKLRTVGDGIEAVRRLAAKSKRAGRNRIAKGAPEENVVRIAPDVQAAFPNEASVNKALRELLRFQENLAQITLDKVKRKKTA